MKTLLKIETDLYQELMAHLLPLDNASEQAAFLFASQALHNKSIVFEVTEARKLWPADFDTQEDDYLEITDATRASLIKQAHDLEASLIEIHSHRGSWPAAFSFADRIGLQETVPHMWWRLNSRPYMALVVTKSNFDALLWLDNPKIPRALDALLINGKSMKPNNFSLGGWE